MWSDNEAEIDLLNVEHLVSAVLRVVKDDRLDPVTVGVYGDWGSGKSSVIQLLRQRIASEPDLLAIYFNGWQFEGYEDAKAALASTILEQIQEEAEKPKGSKLGHIKDKVISAVGGFWGRIDKLRLGKQALTLGTNATLAAGALAIGGTAAAPVTGAAILAVLLKSVMESGKDFDGEKLAELLKEREKSEAQEKRDVHVSVRDFHKEFGQLVAQLGMKRLVVIVDDLDRCLPHNVVETLEAIRLFLSAPKTAFVIAADETLIREAVSSRYPEPVTSGLDGRRASVGTRYLEKLIQVPIRVPPLSPSDLHGYLNLLFAEDRETDRASFVALCDRVRAASSYDAISFHAGNAATLLGVEVSDELRSDFLLAEQIAPVLALSAEGNPRQTKRFLNALVLRIQMAEDRKVMLDRAVAAKMLLLEYFLPELFRTLALEAAADGQSETLAMLEQRARNEDGELRDGGAEGEVAGTRSTFASQASTMLGNERFRTWLRVDPSLSTVDLRPYVYFAHERYALPVSIVQRLSPMGAQALARLLGDSEAEQTAGADETVRLPIHEVTAIVNELTTRARASGVDLRPRTSPIHAMVVVAKKRPEAGPDVLAAIIGIPYEALPPGAAVLVSSLASHGLLREAALSALHTLATQERNPSLKSAALSRIQTLRSTSQTGRG